MLEPLRTSRVDRNGEQVVSGGCENPLCELFGEQDPIKKADERMDSNVISPRLTSSTWIGNTFCPIILAKT